MKIISPFKDYYDFKVSQYGIDSLLIYERRNNIHLAPNCHVTPLEHLVRPSADMGLTNPEQYVLHYLLYIGDYYIPLFASQKKVYSYFDLIIPKQQEKIINRVNVYHSLKRFKGLHKLSFNDGQEYFLTSAFHHNTAYYGLHHRTKSNVFNIFMGNKTDDVFFQKCLTTPIILQYFDYTAYPYIKEDYYRTYLNVNLSKLGIFLDPDFVWQALVEFLSRLRTEQEISPVVENDLKILNKGFDPKISFRPKMKH